MKEPIFVDTPPVIEEAWALAERLDVSYWTALLLLE